MGTISLGKDNFEIHSGDQALQIIKNAKIIQLNCGHYVHYYESDCISEEIMRFIE